MSARPTPNDLDGVLEIDGTNDYILPLPECGEGQGVWITVGPVAVYIRVPAGRDRVEVSLGPNGFELDRDLAFCEVTFAEAQERIDQYEREEREARA